MTLKFYNTLSRKKEDFVPLDDNLVKIYTCGPTVYNYAHIGNFRSFIFMDILRRYLKYKGFKLKHVMNLTDVDDKTIRDSQKKGESLKDFTEFYSKEFFKDFESLKIEKPEIIVKASEHIKEMVNTIKILLDKGYAYKADKGSIYFSINKFPEYGKLANLKKVNLKKSNSCRLSMDEYDKEDAKDFALWKAYDKKDGDVFWDTEIGKGRPGWHIECSSMSVKYLNNPFDIHTGGVDLIFPHHTNEIAQTEAETGRKFVNFWMHSEHLMVDGKKMSKSLGNFYTLRDILNKGFSPMSVRYVLLAAHYRQQLNFTFESVDASKNSIERINEFILRLKDINSSNNSNTENIIRLINKTKKDFETAMDDDLNISEGLATIFEFIKEVNKSIDDNKISKTNADKCLDLTKSFDKILGIMKFEENLLEQEFQELIKKREIARKNKNWTESDKIRDELKQKGIILDDTKSGTRWKRI